MGWVFAWPGCMTQQLLPAQKKLPLTLDLTVPAPNILVTDVFGNVIFIDISCLETGTSLTPCASEVSHPKSIKVRETDCMKKQIGVRGKRS
jgi:hypothetical protein